MNFKSKLYNCWVSIEHFIKTLVAGQANHETRIATLELTIASTWHTGSGVPGAGVGSNGDMYINTDNGDYYRKSAGAWGSALGTIYGRTWYTTLGDVARPTGVKDGDLLLIESTAGVDTKGDVLKYNGATWDLLCNIAGTDGAPGAKGDTGNAIIAVLLQADFEALVGRSVGDRYYISDTLKINEINAIDGSGTPTGWFAYDATSETPAP